MAETTDIPQRLYHFKTEIEALLGRRAHLEEGVLEVIYEYPSRADTVRKIAADTAILSSHGFAATAKRGVISIRFKNIGTAIEARYVKSTSNICNSRVNRPIGAA